MYVNTHSFLVLSVQFSLSCSIIFELLHQEITVNLQFKSILILQRITIKEIKNHPWFLKNLPRELTEAAQALYYRRENPTFSLQSVEDIMKIVDEAKTPPPVSRSIIGGFGWGGEEDEEEKEDKEEKEEKEEVETEEEEEDEYEKQVKEAHASGEVHIT